METTKSSDFKRFTVCKICFNSSKDQRNPLLTLPVADPITSGASQPKSKRDKCPIYRHAFIPVTVYQEPESQKWEIIRQNIQISRICRYKKEGKCRFGESCRFAHNNAELALATPQKPQRQQKQSKSEVDLIREPPPIRVCNKYRLCPYKMEGRCNFGRYCTFAHSDAELQAWIQRRNPTTMSAKQTSEHISNTATPKRGLMSTTKSSPGMSESSDAKLKPTDLKQESDSLDFASKIRSEIVIEYREDKDLSSCFDETYENVTIRKTSDLESSLIVSKDDLIEWTFELSVESAQTLSSVILFDTLVSGFEICDTYIENKATKKQTKLQIKERAQQGIGLRFEREFGRSEIVLVKV